MSSDSYTSLNFSQLKKQCQQLKLPDRGNKKDLILRLQEYDKQNPDSSIVATDTTIIASDHDTAIDKVSVTVRHRHTIDYGATTNNPWKQQIKRSQSVWKEPTKNVSEEKEAEIVDKKNKDEQKRNSIIIKESETDKIDEEMEINKDESTLCRKHSEEEQKKQTNVGKCLHSDNNEKENDKISEDKHHRHTIDYGTPTNNPWKQKAKNKQKPLTPKRSQRVWKEPTKNNKNPPKRTNKCVVSEETEATSVDNEQKRNSIIITESVTDEINEEMETNKYELQQLKAESNELTLCRKQLEEEKKQTNVDKCLHSDDNEKVKIQREPLNDKISIRHRHTVDYVTPTNNPWKQQIKDKKKPPPPKSRSYKRFQKPKPPKRTNKCVVLEEKEAVVDNKDQQRRNSINIKESLCELTSDEIDEETEIIKEENKKLEKKYKCLENKYSKKCQELVLCRKKLEEEQKKQTNVDKSDHSDDNEKVKFLREQLLINTLNDELEQRNQEIQRLRYNQQSINTKLEQWNTKYNDLIRSNKEIKQNYEDKLRKKNAEFKALKFKFDHEVNCCEGKTPMTKTEKPQKQHSMMRRFVGELDGLIKILTGHLDFIDKQSLNVDQLIKSYEEKTGISSLSAAKNKALETEKKLLQRIMNIPEMNKFLDNIILIENLFNLLYTKQHKMKQEDARTKYAGNISFYESKSKPICEINSFVELLFAGTVHIRAFEELLENVEQKCKQRNIRIIENSGAKAKGIERAFYKAFFVYSSDFSDEGIEGFKRMTDVLRCSLVFDNFIDLYKCFDVIQSIMIDKGGILRCKDKFNPSNIEFGYRDLLMNIYCPQSKIVCEIQLHHMMFYEYKRISHIMYEKARLFEKNNGNEAYKYANKHNRQRIGNSIYQIKHDDNDDFKQENIDPIKLLQQWGLTEYKKILIDKNGWCDVEDWRKLTETKLQKDMKFKQGHAAKFVRLYKRIRKL